METVPELASQRRQQIARSIAHQPDAAGAAGLRPHSRLRQNQGVHGRGCVIPRRVEVSYHIPHERRFEGWTADRRAAREDGCKDVSHEAAAACWSAELDTFPRWQLESDLHVVQRHYIEADVALRQPPGIDDESTPGDDRVDGQRHNLLRPRGSAREQHQGDVVRAIMTGRRRAG